MTTIEIPRNSVELLPRLGLDNVDVWELYRSCILDRALVTLDCQIGRMYLSYAPIINGSRIWTKPPDWLICAIDALIRHYRAIDMDEYLNKMFNT